MMWDGVERRRGSRTECCAVHAMIDAGIQQILQHQKEIKEEYDKTKKELADKIDDIKTTVIGEIPVLKNKAENNRSLIIWGASILFAIDVIMLGYLVSHISSSGI